MCSLSTPIRSTVRGTPGGWKTWKTPARCGTPGEDTGGAGTHNETDTVTHVTLMNWNRAGLEEGHMRMGWPVSSRGGRAASCMYNPFNCIRVSGPPKDRACFARGVLSGTPREGTSTLRA